VPRIQFARQMLSIGSLLRHVVDLGQFVEIGQGQVHQREQIRWTRRSYQLDTQALRLDLLTSAKDEVRHHYETFLSQIDRILLLDALIWPFAFTAVQYSDQFVPTTPEKCPSCAEARHPTLYSLWIFLVGANLILPFWSILMLIRCKIKLDRWLQDSLDHLQELRKQTVCEAAGVTSLQKQCSILGMPPGSKAQGRLEEEVERQGMEQTVRRMGSVVVVLMENLDKTWKDECGWLVKSAMAIMWMSCATALLLCSLMFWFSLVNRRSKDEAQRNAPHRFGVLILFGFVCPLIYWLRMVWRSAGDSHGELVSHWNPDCSELQVPPGMDLRRCRSAPPYCKQFPDSRVSWASTHEEPPLAPGESFREPLLKVDDDDDTDDQVRRNRHLVALLSDLFCRRRSAKRGATAADVIQNHGF